jgi:hypothetical protein
MWSKHKPFASVESLRFATRIELLFVFQAAINVLVVDVKAPWINSKTISRF